MSFLTPEQASFCIAVIQFVFAVSLLPTIINPNAQVPRRTSVTTASGLWLIAIIYLGLGPLWLAFWMASLCALGWTFVAICRPVRGALVRAVDAVSDLADEQDNSFSSPPK